MHVYRSMCISLTLMFTLLIEIFLYFNANSSCHAVNFKYLNIHVCI